MRLTVRRIEEDHQEDIRIPNEPFSLFGKLIPTYKDGVWAYRTELFPDDEVTTMCFPEEFYDYDTMKESFTFIGAYDGETCIGVGIFQESWNKFLYLYDLKVQAAYRGHNVAHAIMEQGKGLSIEKGYLGVHTIAQDNNLGACRFYLKNGFDIGGFNTHVYLGTSQEGKADIHFYWEKES